MDKSISALIWDVAELLRGDYKQNEYGSIILPFTVLRRLDCLLDDNRDKVYQKWLVIEKDNKQILATNPAIAMSDLAINRVLNKEAKLTDS